MRLSRSTLLLVIAVWFTVFGCGGGSSSEPLDEVGQRYTATIAIQDLDEETLTVDVIQNSCDGEPEDYGPASAAVSFTVNDDQALGITLKSYVLEYIPLPSEDGTGTIVTPPTLNAPLTGGNLGIDILPGETVEFEITCFSTDQKEEFRRKNGWIFYFEDPAGQLELAAILTEIENLQADIDALYASIPGAPDQDAIDLINSQIEALTVQQDALIDEYNTLYFSFVPPLPDLEEARYRFRITFNFEDATGEDRKIVREATIWLGPYNNC